MKTLPAPRSFMINLMAPPPPLFGKVEDPDYAAVTDDGTQNIITDLLDAMESHDATALCFVSGNVPRYQINGELVDVPNADGIDLDELMEDLISLGVIYNGYRYLYSYKPVNSKIEEMEFVVDTFATPGIYSVALLLQKKTYR